MTFPLVSLHFQESEYDTLSPEIFFLLACRHSGPYLGPVLVSAERYTVIENNDLK